jgi:hypothetical protein
MATRAVRVGRICSEHQRLHHHRPNHSHANISKNRADTLHPYSLLVSHRDGHRNPAMRQRQFQLHLLYTEARRCHDNHLDESAWVKVVNNVLEAADLDDDSAMLRLHSIQTQSIEPAFLPKHTSQSFAKKADLALAFSDHPAVAAAIETVSKAHPDLPLSQMTDAYTSAVPLVCGVEVRERGGDYSEAILQLGIWCAAGLERLQGLWELGNQNLEQGDPPLFCGWTVVGHDWKFHVAWKNPRGNVVCRLLFARGYILLMCHYRPSSAHGTS